MNHEESQWSKKVALSRIKQKSRTEVVNNRSFFCGIYHVFNSYHVIDTNLLYCSFQLVLGHIPNLDQVRDCYLASGPQGCSLKFVTSISLLNYWAGHIENRLFCLNICLSTLPLACRVKNGAQFNFFNSCRSPWRLAMSSCRLGGLKTMPKVLVSF